MSDQLQPEKAPQIAKVEIDTDEPTTPALDKSEAKAQTGNQAGQVEQQNQGWCGRNCSHCKVGCSRVLNRFPDCLCFVVLFVSVVAFWLISTPLYGGHMSYLLYGMNDAGQICGLEKAASYTFVYRRNGGPIVCANKCPSNSDLSFKYQCYLNGTIDCGQLAETVEQHNICQTSPPNINATTNLDWVRQQVYSMATNWQLGLFNIAVTAIYMMVFWGVVYIFQKCKGDFYDEFIRAEDRQLGEALLGTRFVNSNFLVCMNAAMSIAFGVLLLVMDSTGVVNIIISTASFLYSTYSLLNQIFKPSKRIRESLFNVMLLYYSKRHKSMILISFIGGLLFTGFYIYWYFVFVISFSVGKEDPAQFQTGQVLNDVQFDNSLAALQVLFILIFLFISEVIIKITAFWSCLIVIFKFYTGSMYLSCGKKCQVHFMKTICTAFITIGSVGSGAFLNLFGFVLKPVTMLSWNLLAGLGWIRTDNVNIIGILISVLYSGQCSMLCNMNRLSQLNDQNYQRYLKGQTGNSCCVSFLKRLIFVVDIRSFVGMAMELSRVKGAADANYYANLYRRIKDEEELQELDLFEADKKPQPNEQRNCYTGCLQRLEKDLDQGQEGQCDCQCGDCPCEGCCCHLDGISSPHFYTDSFYVPEPLHRKCCLFYTTTEELKFVLINSDRDFQDYWFQVSKTIQTLKYNAVFVSVLSCFIYAYTYSGFSSRLYGILFLFVIWTRTAYLIASFFMVPFETCSTFLLMLLCSKSGLRSFIKTTDSRQKEFFTSLLKALDQAKVKIGMTEEQQTSREMQMEQKGAQQPIPQSQPAEEDEAQQPMERKSQTSQSGNQQPIVNDSLEG